ncbi:hypothetical protein [Ralstonia phage RSL2]|uniref:Uncharacterized protein n=1 Tax=Ralstonia phage RSL2 TaxID=1585840 RepID=A0A0A8J8V4_9CAUD|nr:hypothetical protein [Ralstonia phage RSL2]
MQEEIILDLLMTPYGVEKTSSDIVRDAEGKLSADGLMEKMELLEKRGYLKSRFVTPEGYLVSRRIFSINHVRLHKESRLRLRTRLEIDRICNFKIAA